MGMVRAVPKFACLHPGLNGPDGRRTKLATTVSTDSVWRAAIIL